MNSCINHYIDGAWRAPLGGGVAEVIDPSTEAPCGRVALGAPGDVDAAVAAARRAYDTFSQTSRDERLQLLSRILSVYGARMADLGDAMSLEMGAPRGFARAIQAGVGAAHLAKMIEVLERFVFNERRGAVDIIHEPIGVVGLITPWNWPMNQILCKVAPALAAGCTIVLKPSELAPLSATLLAEILHEAATPAGVFNMVHGDGPTVGQAIAGHSDIDMVSFTGSTRAGIAVAKLAAATVKRVAQELGGKSANIILPDADFERAVAGGVHRCFANSGQSCNAPTRMLVPEDRYEEAAALARQAASQVVVGDPGDPQVTMGPVANADQFEKIQWAIAQGLADGAQLLAGGVGRPEGLAVGYYVRPTVFGRVTPDMALAREEIFGPVLSIMTYQDEDDAVRLTNDSIYGLAAYVQSGDPVRAARLTRRLRAGTIYVNDPEWDAGAPFGGYKQSGNGREYAEFGLADFLEIKGVVGLDRALALA